MDLCRLTLFETFPENQKRFPGTNPIIGYCIPRIAKEFRLIPIGIICPNSTIITYPVIGS